MPQSLNYTPLLGLVSNQRIASYRAIFLHDSDAELYGTYVWSQYAAASLYPIFQNIEVTLRNSIDNAARSKFGDKWWDQIKVNDCRGNQAQSKFYNNMASAKKKLNYAWEKREKSRLGLKSRAILPAISVRPKWTHDQIIAATDFSTWEFILLDGFSSNRPTDLSGFLWPKLLGKAFRKYHSISASPDKARNGIRNLVAEIRGYRNRIFHHEPLWIKAPTVTNEIGAVDTIRHKINQMEKLVNAIDQRKLEVLNRIGVFRNARRICSIQELQLYKYNHGDYMGTTKQKRIIRKMLSATSKHEKTSAFEYSSQIFGVYRIR